MQKIFIFAAIIVLAVIAWFGYGKAVVRQDGSTTEQNSNNIVVTSSTLPVITVISTTTASTSVSNTVKDATVSFAMPSLERSIEPRILLSLFAKEDAMKQIARLTSILKGNPDDYSSWITFGVYRKILGDYIGAEEVWKYVTVRWPTDFVAYNNLGDLYHLYLKDYPKAEEYFVKTVNLNPFFIQTYYNLYDLYRYSYKGKEAQAPSALILGLEKNPNNLNLMIKLARHYGEIKNSEQAEKYYNMAIQRAEIESKSDLVESLRKEASE